ncbi:TrbC/VirB2 family protein, partial [Ideonella sp.]|uniref:TrbC/VirB2 family protein n=1 Tax=Ideonella sp. TaxID=1929293 RepID=UPI002B46F238
MTLCHANSPLARAATFLFVALAAALPVAAFADSPFSTGASALPAQVLVILTPLAAVAVMGSGALAWFGRISWMWFIGAILGTVLVFGAPQIVTWIR